MPTVYQANIVNVSCTVAGASPSFALDVISNGPGGTYYQAQLWSGAPGSLIAVGTPTAATMSQNLTWEYATQVPGGSGLASNLTYWLTACACGAGGSNAGPASPAVKVVYTPVPLTQVTVDGSQVTLQWSYTAANAVTADGLMVQIESANDAFGPIVTLPLTGFVLGTSPNFVYAGSFDIDFPLALAPPLLTLTFWPYSETPSAGQISSVQAVCNGPSVSQPFYFGGPSIQSAQAVANEPEQYSLTVPNVLGVSAATGVSLVPTVTVGGVPVTGAKLSTPVVSTTTITTTLSLPAGCPVGARLDVALAQYDGLTPSVSAGPVGPAHTLITAIPLWIRSNFTASATAGGAATLTFTIAYPPAAPEMTAAQLSVVDASGTVVVGPVTVAGTSGGLSLPADKVTPGSTYNVTLQGASGGDTGPAAPLVPLLSMPPTLQTVAFDGAIASASWTAPEGVAVSVYGLYVGEGEDAAAVYVSGLTGEIAVPLCTAPTLVVRAVWPNLIASGPISCRVTLPTEALSVASVTTDPVSGLATVTWTDPQANAGYVVQVYQNGAASGTALSSMSSHYVFTAAFAADADIEIAVATSVSVTPPPQSTAVTVTGPFGPRKRVRTALPTILDTDFDGVNAYVVWTPVLGATGYNVFVLVASVAGPAFAAAASATSASVAVPTPIVASNSYQVVVQALFGADSGLATAPSSIFVPGYYLAPSSTTAGNAIYPATSLTLPMVTTLSALAAASTDMVCYLPSLASGAVGSVTSAGPFSLAANPGPGVANYPFALTIAGGANSDAWNFDGAAIRTKPLQNDYVAFLQNAETAGVAPYGIAVIQQAIARLLPQTFAETLYYAYGFDTTAGTVDLRPGTILRISADPYQFVTDASQEAAGNGFVGGPTLEFAIMSYLSGGSRIVGFDAFLAQLVAAQAISVTPPILDASSWQQPALADAADLFFPSFQQPFYRLFMPSTLLAPWGTGSDLPAINMAIAAASSFTNLSGATSTGTGGLAAALAYFGGRAVARLCIRVNVLGNDHVVPVGTTVGNVLDMLGLRPLSTGAALDGLTLSRALGGVVMAPTAPIAVDARYRVRFDWNSLSIYGFAADALDLPLLHGDRLTFTD